MGQHKLKGKDLRGIDYTDNSTISLAIELANKHLKHETLEEKLKFLTTLKKEPFPYQNDQYWRKLVAKLQPQEKVQSVGKSYRLAQQAKGFVTFGNNLIDEHAKQQMEMAMKLPIAEYGALLPDAHQGYGLPIGGTLATNEAIIPYGVGVDIGCRMSLTIFDASIAYLERYRYQFKRALKENTCFGTGGELPGIKDHEVLERDEFNLTPLLRKLHGKAVRQLGTSGSGNHFVEFGEVVLEPGNSLGVPAGSYLGLMAHSGSRGLGASIANTYTQLAKEQCWLPKEAQHMAWLDLHSEAGQEYWMSMNLAGDYAKACHDHIHDNIAHAMGLKAISKIENHHNFAWKEIHFGKEVIVHRKGATPAHRGEYGIIPGSMTAAGYIVEGNGNPNSLMSASHGAGRKMSRTKAKNSITGSDMKQILQRENVELIGGGIDEAPIAYKDIEQVMMAQKHLVSILGKFTPRMVRMDKN